MYILIYVYLSEKHYLFIGKTKFIIHILIKIKI